MITALLLTAGALWLIGRNKRVSGIGAAKRRIYKEISLAQQAGVDFTKKYEDLTDDEILALQRVSNDTGFTETYYKGLKKAYDAISGIGEAYDVADENGNTVLTWIEDPEIHAAHNREIEEARQRTLEAEARAEKARKSKRATERRLQQMSLFGCGTGALSVEDGLEPELLEFVRQNVDPRRMSIAFDQIDEMRCPLSMAEPTLYDQIIDLVEEWCTDNAIDADDIWSLFDAEDIFWAL